MPLNYRIHLLSAASMLGYAEQTKKEYRYCLSKSGTEYCRMKAASQTQEDNALFYQILSVLHGGKTSLPTDGFVVTELTDVIFYMDFSGIFGTGSSLPFWWVPRSLIRVSGSVPSSKVVSSEIYGAKLHSFFSTMPFLVRRSSVRQPSTSLKRSV